MTQLPRFWFGQSVMCQRFSEEENREMTDSGVIVGICFQAPLLLVDGWWYAIRFSSIDSCDWLPVGHVDWAHESEIRLVEQPRSFVNPVR